MQKLEAAAEKSRNTATAPLTTLHAKRDALAERLEKRPCVCNISLPLNETAFLETADSWDFARLGDPDCLLASVNMSDCTVNFSNGTPSAADEARLRDVLRQSDRLVLSKKYRNILDVRGPEPTPARARRLVCTSLSVVVLAIYVRREMSKAMLVARIVLSHAGGCLPAFFAPLYLVYEDASPQPLGFWAAALLLLLPFLQAAVALGVMLATSLTAIPEELAPNAVQVIFNAVALLFILEVDNLVGQWVQERAYCAGCVDPDSLFEHTLVDRRHRTCRGNSDVAQRRLRPGECGWPRVRWACGRVFGHFYMAALGFLCFTEVGVATIDLTRAVLVHGLNPYNEFFETNQRDPASDRFTPPLASIAFAPGSAMKKWLQVVGFLVFAGSYTLLAILLFEPPVPPLCAEFTWRVAHKTALVMTTWLAFMLPTDIWRVGKPDEPGTYVFRMGPQFFWTYLPAVATLWAIVHVMWPLRACRRRRLAQRLSTLTNTVGLPGGDGVLKPPLQPQQPQQQLQV